VATAGYDADGVKTNDFSETQEISRNAIKFSTRNNAVTTTQYYQFNEQGLLTGIIDSSSSVTSTSSYNYDAKNNLVSIKNIVSDTDDSIYLNEQHLWYYNSNGRLVKMYRVVNNNDSTEIRFTLDEMGNVTEEQPFKRTRGGEKTFYYYDDKNRLTDIVRYNTKAKRLLPDFMFEYSANNQVIQKVTTLSTMGLGYLIWRYVYDDKGLKTKEASFNRDKIMTGKIEYSYRFFP